MLYAIRRYPLRLKLLSSNILHSLKSLLNFACRYFLQVGEMSLNRVSLEI